MVKPENKLTVVTTKNDAKKLKKYLKLLNCILKKVAKVFMKNSIRNKNVRKSKFSLNGFETKKDTRKKEINVTK